MELKIEENLNELREGAKSYTNPFGTPVPKKKRGGARIVKVKKPTKKTDALPPVIGYDYENFVKSKIVEVHKSVPEDWDNRDWRLQIYAWIAECAEKFDCSPLEFIRSCGYTKNKHKVWLEAMSKENKVFFMLNITMIQDMARKAHHPFVLM